MTFHIITIFPHIFDSYLKEGILSRAQKNNLIKINILNLRDFTSDKHKTVDDKPFGGGPGMVLKVEPIYKAIEQIKSKKQTKKTKTILLSAKGKKFNQKMAYKFSKLSDLILICGRYEGVDERVAKYIADEEISLGPYVLSGGEIGAMILVESISRLLPGVIGKEESLKEESFSQNFILEYPQYTRPPKFYPLKNKNISWNVPKILLSGHHQKIEEFKRKRGKRRIEAENEKKQQPK